MQKIKKARIRRQWSWILGHPKDIDPLTIKSDATQAVYGEVFNIEETDQGWAKGALATDGYEGWISLSDLTAITDEYERPNAYCTAIHSHIYERPDIKARPKQAIAFMSPLIVNPDETEDNFIAMRDGGWVNVQHITATYDIKNGPDAHVTAERFIGTPYVYGGRSAQGIDCSALIQLSYARRGVKLPRDSGDQAEKYASDAVTLGSDDLDTRPLQTGDIVFFPGHVGIMCSEDEMIHAFSDTMRVQKDKVSDIASFYKEHKGEGITAIRRL